MKNLVLSHFTTWHFVQYLKKELVGAVLVDAYSVSKEQTVFEFDAPNGPFYLLTYFSGHNAFFWTQDSYGKPRSKYNTKYKSFYGAEVKTIFDFENERSFALSFGNFSLFFALFGRMNSIHKVETPKKLEWEVQVSETQKRAFLANDSLNTDLDFLRLVYGKNESEEALVKHKNAIEKGLFSVAVNEKEQLIFGFGLEQSIFESNKIADALRHYAKAWFKKFQYEQGHQKIEKYLSSEKRKTEKALSAAKLQLKRIENDLNYRNWADLIMANLHNIPSDAKKVELDDFYSDTKISIELKSKLSPQENAANYYRKAKNQGKEIENLNNRIERSFEKLEFLEEKIALFEGVEDVKSLQRLEQELFPTSKGNSQVQESRFLEFEIDSYKVYVGRNSKNNDELTLGFAGKNDLWLHAKDMAGSHVVIRNKGSQITYPKYVIEQVAQIAAYYSKGRNQEFCPVLYTLKKYIRKPKGAPAGAVLVDREDVVLVRPSLP